MGELGVWINKKLLKGEEKTFKEGNEVFINASYWNISVGGNDRSLGTEILMG